MSSQTYADLHLHTNRSDGTNSPEELVALAKAAGVSLMAITDHDTVSAVKAGQDAATKAGIQNIPGIEISSKYTGGVLHILGYGIDINNAYLAEKLEEFQYARKHRNEKIILKLRELGIDIRDTEIAAMTKDVSSLGRPHIARALIGKGVVGSIQEAFDVYLGTGKKAFVDKEIFSSAETIEIIHQAGGKAFLAHPASLHLSGGELKDYLKRLISEGLDGMEVYSASHTAPKTAVFEQLAAELNLLVSAGSDFHGKNKPNIFVGEINQGKKVNQSTVSEVLWQ